MLQFELYIQVKLKEGVTFLGARPSNPTQWMVSQDVRSEGHRVVTLHCRRKESGYDQQSEALFHVLEPSEDPNTFLQKRPITSPVILDSTNLLLAVGKIPLMTLPREMMHEAPLILMGCFYTFHLAYPKCVATLLSVIQTEVLKDSIHERDLTHSYKKAITEWAEFTKK
ncbi:hypothetical protein JOQ06_012010 [Pogonophryne albipinna]|uniref:Transmembrane protein TMEM132 cohesin-like domain-containing protein n=1 Tax=Pogonophryne albipinna TaxID=1090488 RepID=A0AAD6FR01_9TELE|nr:hypothetical protein JOQ06_012010 [Pogonophryne albipinna]